MIIITVEGFKSFSVFAFHRQCAQHFISEALYAHFGEFVGYEALF